MNAVLLVYLVFFVAPISNLFHEVGHMLGAKLAKADRITIHVGRGKRLFKFVFQNIELHLGRAFFTTGLTLSKRKDNYRSFEIIYITFMGPFFNAIIVFIFYLLYNLLPNTYILLFILYNSWLCLINCIPFKIGKQESDGYIIIKEMFRKMYTSR